MPINSAYTLTLSNEILLSARYFSYMLLKYYRLYSTMKEGLTSVLLLILLSKVEQFHLILSRKVYIPIAIQSAP